jgi:hypothetical protein
MDMQRNDTMEDQEKEKEQEKDKMFEATRRNLSEARTAIVQTLHSLMVRNNHLENLDFRTAELLEFSKKISDHELARRTAWQRIANFSRRTTTKIFARCDACVLFCGRRGSTICLDT